ncbi:MAG: glycosyl hydrolase [Cyanobium sp.]
MVATSAATASLLVMLSHASTQPPKRPLLGIYEPITSAIQNTPMDIEVLFLDWNDKDAVPLLQAFLGEAQRRQRLPLLTLEPFPDRAGGRTNNDLLADVFMGRHDKAIATITQTLATHPGPVLLRFAHEMDKPGQYPWGFADPDRYLRLYNYVYGKVMAEGPTNLRWVWSPAGASNADLYWPGDASVDLIGLSIYSSRAWTPDRSLESFSQQLGQKRWLQRRFGRPLLVAEAGVSGSSADQRRWIEEAVASLPQFPEVCGLVYFQAHQPRWMPLPTGHENWELKAAPLRWLLAQRTLPARRGQSCVEG